MDKEATLTREVLDAMNADSGVPLTALKVDGGMVFNNLLMQFQANVLGVPVIRPRKADGSWHTPFLTFDETGFQEGNSWQYSWLAPHDARSVRARAQTAPGPASSRACPCDRHSA